MAINKIENCKSLIRILIAQGKNPELAQTPYGEQIYRRAIQSGALNIFEIINHGK